MHALVLTRNRYLYATRRIISTLIRRGHDVSIADPLACSAVIDHEPTARKVIAGGELLAPDAVIGRSSAMTRDAVVRLLRHFEPSCHAIINRADALSLSCDKFATLGVLSAAGVPVPPSRLLHSDAGLEEAIGSLGSGSLVIKTLDGGRGRGVCLTESTASSRSVAQALLDEGRAVMLQHYYAECRGKDLRVFVVGGKLVACSERVGVRGDFRANAHCGGTMTIREPSAEIARMALVAVEALGLEVAGVDILETDQGPVVLEVNGTPGLRGVEESTDTDVAALIAERLEALAAAGGAKSIR